MHYIVCIKLHTNIHSDIFWLQVMPSPGSSDSTVVSSRHILMIISHKRRQNDYKHLINIRYMN